MDRKYTKLAMKLINKKNQWMQLYWNFQMIKKTKFYYENLREHSKNKIKILESASKNKQNKKFKAVKNGDNRILKKWNTKRMRYLEMGKKIAYQIQKDSHLLMETLE